MPSTNTAAELARLNAFAVASVAAASVARSLAVADNDGRPVEVSVEPAVSLYGDKIRVFVKENGMITADVCRQVCNAARLAVRDALLAAGIEAKGQTWKAKGGAVGRLHQTGDWSMGTFWCSGRYCEFNLT